MSKDFKDVLEVRTEVSQCDLTICGMPHNLVIFSLFSQLCLIRILWGSEKCSNCKSSSYRDWNYGGLFFVKRFSSYSKSLFELAEVRITRVRIRQI